MPQNKLLRYEIDDWSQVTECKSNNSRKLHLTYDNVLASDLTGGVVRVEHDLYGCLFAYLVNGSGTVLSEQRDGIMYELTTGQVLSELAKYGFLIQFTHRPVLDDDQFNLLVTAQGLGLNKIRIMYVDMSSVLVPNLSNEYRRRGYLVAFNVDKLPKWLNNTHTCTTEEYFKAVTEKGAVNLSAAQGGLDGGHNWQFLVDKVLNIEDLLKVAR